QAAREVPRARLRGRAQAAAEARAGRGSAEAGGADLRTPGQALQQPPVTPLRLLNPGLVPGFLAVSPSHHLTCRTLSISTSPAAPPGDTPYRRYPHRPALFFSCSSKGINSCKCSLIFD